MLSRSYGGRVCGDVACFLPVLTRLLSVPCLGHKNRTRGAAQGPSKPRNRQMSQPGSPRAGPSRPLCLSGVRLGPTEGRSPTSLAELTIRREPYRVEVRLQLPRVDGLPCRVRAVGLRRELVVQHVLWGPADASARFEPDAPQQHSRYTRRGYTFSFRVSWVDSTLAADETEDGWRGGGFTACTDVHVSLTFRARFA